MAPSVEISPTRLRDVLGFWMRSLDAAEVLSSGGLSPRAALMESWAHSQYARTARINGEVAAVFGCSPHPSSAILAPLAVAWCLTTPVVDRHPITFFRHSKVITRDMAAQYGTLINFVPVWYKQALEWARRIGFHVAPAVEFGIQKEQFHPIIYGG